MDWAEKEATFYKRYHAGTCGKNIWKYIPQKALEGVDNAFVDYDGYWIWLNEDYVAYDGAEDCRQIHAYTITDLIEDIKTIRRVTK